MGERSAVPTLVQIHGQEMDGNDLDSGADSSPRKLKNRQGLIELRDYKQCGINIAEMFNNPLISGDIGRRELKVYATDFTADSVTVSDL